MDELLKILDLENFKNILKNENRKLIFSLIFPELKYLDRLLRLNKIDEKVIIKNDSLLAVLLIDEKDSHEYFFHKYKVSNDTKDNLNLLAKNFKILKKDKNFFSKNLEKNIYINNKEHMKTLNLLDFLSNSKYNLQNFLNIFNKISDSKVQKFPYSGEYLKNNGMKEGLVLGKVIKILEKEWIENNFKISNKRVREVIEQNLH